MGNALGSCACLQVRPFAFFASRPRPALLGTRPGRTYRARRRMPSACRAHHPHALGGQHCHNNVLCCCAACSRAALTHAALPAL